VGVNKTPFISFSNDEERVNDESSKRPVESSKRPVDISKQALAFEAKDLEIINQ
jgi:hypothetical protein